MILPDVTVGQALAPAYRRAGIIAAVRAEAACNRGDHAGALCLTRAARQNAAVAARLEAAGI